MADVVIDASVWIDYLSGAKIQSVDDAVTDDLAVIPPLVVAELVTGALTPAMREAVGELLQDVWVHETPLEHWIDVGTLRRLLGRKGINATVPDAHIAQCALDLEASLLTRDKIFAEIAKHTRLRLAR
ncbi:MAG TPA: PIN domain-containing protein [Thermoanaerobaculia bacterium]|nr:PIN domain-containing protein [Thermoanaerobaculia bacterium]